jgi:annexin A7/11
MPSPSGPPLPNPNTGGFQYISPTGVPPVTPYGQNYPPPQGPPPQQTSFASPNFPPKDMNVPITYSNVLLLSDPRNPYPPPIPASLPHYPPDRISADVEVIRKACRGFGTDESALNKVLCGGGPRPWSEIEILKEAWKRREGKDLESTLKSELSGWLEFGLLGRIAGPVALDLLLLEKVGINLADTF